MPRKVDANQPEITKALRQIGATVQPLDNGRGVPDLLVGFRGRNYLLEIKDGKKPPSARKLTADEYRWHQAWNGHVRVVESVQQAIDAVTKLSTGWPEGYEPVIARQIIAAGRSSDANRQQIGQRMREQALAKGVTGTVLMPGTPKNDAPGWVERVKGKAT